MKKKKRAAFLIVRRTLGILLSLLIVSGIGVVAANSKVTNVKIILANGYEMDVMTSKTKVSEILAENHIILLPEEDVSPDYFGEISDNNTIIISTEEIVEVEKAETAIKSSEISAEEILAEYDNIVEKIEVIEEEIPFETITKDVSNTSDEKKDVIVQEGRNGLKEVTYKVKYKNEIEVERTKISEVIIKEAINKVVEVRRKISVTSRYTGSRTTFDGNRWSYTDEELDLICAITAQECSNSYEGALAVITCACNRAESSQWGRYGSDPLSQYKARGQFTYSIDGHYRRRLNGNYSDTVVQAVMDALNGKRNHNYLSFRSAGYASGENIGGNVYFNPMY